MLISVENPIRLVRELKGAPLSILIVLGFAGQRVTQEWLERSTGYTDKPVSQALAYLEEIGLVEHNKKGWALSGSARQLPLPIQQIDAGEADEEQIEETPADVPEDVSISNESRNISDSALNINTTTFNLTDNIDQEVVVVSINDESRNFSDSELDFELEDDETAHSHVDRVGADQEARRSALEYCGIGGSKLVNLAARDDLTAVDILAWERVLKKREKYTPGLLIYVLEAGQEVDKQARQEMERDYRYFCPDCKRFYCDCEVEDE